MLILPMNAATCSGVRPDCGVANKQTNIPNMEVGGWDLAKDDGGKYITM